MKIKIGYGLKLLSFLEMKDRNQDTFKNSYLFKNDEEKTCHVLGKL
jgi:hypothetical protein